jgi:hypothetical protein
VRLLGYLTYSTTRLLPSFAQKVTNKDDGSNFRKGKERLDPTSPSGSAWLAVQVERQSQRERERLQEVYVLLLSLGTIGEGKVSDRLRNWAPVPLIGISKGLDLNNIADACIDDVKTPNSRPEPNAKRPKLGERPVVAQEEDKAFFEEHGQFLTFLDTMQTGETKKYV